MSTRTDRSTGQTVPEPPGVLVGEWTACALVRAVTRFLPVPVLDDAVAERASRVAVSLTLRSQGRTYPVDAVEPLYADGSGRGVGRHLRGLGQVKDLGAAVAGWARDRFRGDEDAEAAVSEPDGPLAGRAQRVQAALEPPEVVRLLEEFDRRMDERLARQGAA